LPRTPTASNNVVAATATSSHHHWTYVRIRKHPRNAAAQDICEENDSNHQDDVQAAVDQPLQADSSRSIEEDESESGGGTAAGDGDAFHLDEDLLL
jgi:hypothetical protein